MIISRIIRWLIVAVLAVIIAGTIYVVHNCTDLFRTVPWATRPAQDVLAIDTTVRFVSHVTLPEGFVVPLPAGYRLEGFSPDETPPTALCYGDTVTLMLQLIPVDSIAVGGTREFYPGVRDPLLLTDSGRRKKFAGENISDDRDFWLAFDLDFYRIATANLEGAAVIKRVRKGEQVIANPFGTRTIVNDNDGNDIWLECMNRDAQVISNLQMGGQQLNLAELLAILANVRRVPHGE